MDEMFSDSLSYLSSVGKTIRDEENDQENYNEELLKSDENLNSSSSSSEDVGDNPNSKEIHQLDLDSGDSQTMRFSEKFKGIKILGSGSFGMVIEAVDLKTGTSQAVKVISKHSVSPGQIDFLRREADILSSLQHENIVKFERVMESETRIFIVMELLNCGSLHSLCKVKHANNEWFSEDETATIMHSIFSAVAYFHSKGVIHRDLKPENILIGDRNDLKTVKIADFGLSTVFETVSSISVTQRCGTLLYMAPEFFARKTYSKPIDVWSCAIIMYKLLSGGHHPFFDSKKDSLKSIKVKIHKTLQIKFPLHFPEGPKNLLRKMMALDPSLRYTANQVLTHPWISKKLGGEVLLTMEETLKIMKDQQGFRQKIQAILFLNFLKHQRVAKQQQQQAARSPLSSSSSLSLSEQYKEKIRTFSIIKARDKQANKKIDVVSSHYFHSVLELEAAITAPQLNAQAVQSLGSETAQNLDSELVQNFDQSSTQTLSLASENHSPQSSSSSSSPVQLRSEGQKRDEQERNQNYLVSDQSPSFNPKRSFPRKEFSPLKNSKKPFYQQTSLGGTTDNPIQTKYLPNTRRLNLQSALPKLAPMNTLDNSRVSQQPEIESPERQTEHARNVAYSAHNYHLSVMNREQLNDCISKKERNQVVSTNPSVSPQKRPIQNGGMPNIPLFRDQTRKFHELLHRDSQEPSPNTNKRTIIISTNKQKSNVQQRYPPQDKEDIENSNDSLNNAQKSIQTATSPPTLSPLRIKIIASAKRVTQSQDTSNFSWNPQYIQSLQQQQQQSTSSEESSKSPGSISPSQPNRTEITNYNSKLIHLQKTELSPEKTSPSDNSKGGSSSLQSSPRQIKNTNSYVQRAAAVCLSTQQSEVVNNNNNNGSKQLLYQTLSKDAQSIIQKSFGPQGQIAYSIQMQNKHRQIRTISQDVKKLLNNTSNNIYSREQNNQNSNNSPQILPRNEPSSFSPLRQPTYSNHSNNNDHTDRPTKTEGVAATRATGSHIHGNRIIIKPKSIIYKKNFI